MAINNFNVGVGTTSQLTRYRYVATGGETSISGTDADGKTLSYTVGLEQVFLNGVNLVRGQDYTATNGTSIGNLTALVASDSLEVFAYVPFNIANALTVSTVDAKGDLLVGTAADTVGRLAVGSTNGQLLSVNSSTSTGLAWINPGLTLIATTDFAQGSTGVSLNNVFTSSYRNYKIIVSNLSGSGATQNLRFRLRKNGTDNTSSIYYIQYLSANSTTVAAARVSTQSSWNIGDVRDQGPMASIFDVLCPQISTQKTNLINTSMTNSTSEPILYFAVQTHDLASSADFDGFTIYPASGSMYGYVSVYGYKE